MAAELELMKLYFSWNIKIVPWSKWTGSVHRSSKGETHPCDDGSSGQAHRHQQEGEQHGPEAHDSNRHWHHLQHHCQKISPWHLTLHPWCGSCQREGPTLCPSLYPLPTPTWSLPPSFPPPKPEKSLPDLLRSVDMLLILRGLIKVNYTEVLPKGVSACHDIRSPDPNTDASVSGWTSCEGTNYHQSKVKSSPKITAYWLMKHQRLPSITADYYRIIGCPSLFHEMWQGPTAVSEHLLIHTKIKIICHLTMLLLLLA